MPPSQKISLNLIPSCCDSGRQGDYPCGIMAKGAMGKISNMQTNLTAVPAGPDERAVPELAGKLIGMVRNRDMMGIGSLSDKLVEYAKDPQFSKQVDSYSPEMVKAFHESDTPWARSAIAKVLIALNSKGLNDDNLDIELPLSLLEETISRLDDQKIAVLNSLQANPRVPEKSLPVLVEVLGNVYDDPELIQVMQTIRSFGKDSAHYLQKVYDRIEDLPREKGESGNPPPENLLTFWKDMVCSVYGLEAPEKTKPSVDCTAIIKP